jgi:long-chain acyl-CoA synthetase
MTVLKTKGITIFPGLPFIFSILADSNSITKVELTDLKLAFTAGAPLSQKIFEGFKNKFGVPLRQLYGSTETGSISINLGKTDDGLWESVGKPMHGVTVMIMSEEGQLLPPCNIGEVVVHSAAMTHGYAGSVEVNREAFRDGYFWSGDLGKLDSDGNLFITGRKKQFINVGANKVDPKEIEELLNTHPSIQESVVLGIPGLYGDEIVKAVLVLNEKLDAEIVKDWLRGKIADFKIPRVIEFRQEIPRSPLGKILRKHLQG